MEDLSWLDETKQIHTFVKNGVRIDGRSFVDHRKVSCRVSTVHADGVVGSAQVQIGGTVVSCGINLKVGTPTADSPDAGEIGELTALDHDTTYIFDLCLFVFQCAVVCLCLVAMRTASTSA